MTLQTTSIRHKDLLRAQQIASRLPELFQNRNLVPAFSGFSICQYPGLNVTILIAALDTDRIGDHARYVDPRLRHQLSTDLGGLRCYLSNTTGIRYVILLSQLPKLPRKVALPIDTVGGRLAIGMKFNLENVSVDWDTTPHIAVLGSTGSGKSIFLQSVVIQAIREGMRLLLSDIDQTTFAAFERHPALLAPIATTPPSALELTEKAIAECDRRAELFKNLPQHPQKISEYNTVVTRHGKEALPQIVVVLDEASAVLSTMGGSKGALGQALATLGWRGRKFGVHFIFGAQEFTREILGAVREQVSLTVCFRVRSAQMAERMGCRGAERIPEGRPGLAITDRFGPVQTYFVEPAMTQGLTLLPAIGEAEHALFTRAIRETNGRLSIPILIGWEIRERAARQMLEQWEKRGWVLRDPQRDNARYITSKLTEILSLKDRDTSNHPAGQTASIPA
jgi:FtsK/SpoIIIE family